MRRMDFVIENVDMLDISKTNTNIDDLKFYNVKKIIISNNNYNENTNFSLDGTDIVIIDDKMNVIKEIKNG